MSQKLIVKQVFLISSFDENVFKSSASDKAVKILIEPAIFIHKGLYLNVNEVQKIAKKLKKPFKVLVSGAMFGELEDEFSILALVVELDTPLDQKESNLNTLDITEISSSRLENDTDQ